MQCDVCPRACRLHEGQRGLCVVRARVDDQVVLTSYGRSSGFKAIAVSAGHIEPAAREALYAHMDAANIDLKAFTDDFYRRVCAGHVAPVLDTLEYLRHQTGVWFEITTLLIPGRNDGDAEIDAEARWVAEHLGVDVPVHFTASIRTTGCATSRRRRRRR